MSLVLQVENLSKEYRLGSISHGYLFRDLQSQWARIRGKDDPNEKINAGQSSKGARYLALDNISFDVEQGEVLGIVGRNGAGKSTLLKILSRVTTPTRGSVKIKGRIASLLEVGTGFHPELTGRENIFLNGAILGMSRAEISSKFAPIVEFAGISAFIDTPVKRYSSGMYVRLAFAVAAHLEPEILIIDEVLAVGDAEFQKKCIGKMSEVANQGRTVLFVSHNTAAVQNLCTKALLIHNGRLMRHGATDTILTEYSALTRERALAQDLSLRQDRQGNGQARFISYAIVNKHGESVTAIQSGEEMAIVLTIRIRQFTSPLSISLGVDDPIGQRLFLMSNDIASGPFLDLAPNEYAITFRIPKIPLKSGQYAFSVFASSSGVILDWIQTAGILDVETGDFYGTGKLPPDSQGPFLLKYDVLLTDAQMKLGAQPASK